jgi:DNA-binding Lrp family transcriptional regulator
MTQEQEVPDILDHILDEAGVSSGSPRRGELRAQFEQRISIVVIETLVANLSAEQRKELFEALAEDSDDAERKVGELSAKVPGLEEKTNQAVAEEVRKMLAEIKG